MLLPWTEKPLNKSNTQQLIMLLWTLNYGAKVIKKYKNYKNWIEQAIAKNFVELLGQIKGQINDKSNEILQWNQN